MAVWNILKIEQKLEEALKNEIGGTDAQEIHADYVKARRDLVESILPEIKGKLPSMTDHGPQHIANVLNNIDALLGNSIESLSSIDLYCLCLSALFHDTGNLFGRKKHNKNISDIYDFIRRSDSYDQEKSIILTTCEAHCGHSKDKSTDTLKDVDEVSHVHGRKVKLRHIAAVLRFADELAEGPQRTSTYMMDRHKYKKASRIHHKYSSITSICIDRGNERIAITYNINIKRDKMKISSVTEKLLRDLLDFIYKRLIKLDQERKYSKFYCTLLSPFKETRVQFNFLLDGKFIDIRLSPIVFADLVIPGDYSKSIPERNKEYEIGNLVKRIKHASNKRGRS